MSRVVTDDNSTDDTLAILEAFARRAPFPVHVLINTLNLGYKASFMHCAELCIGDLIAFSDQDDIWLPEKLEKQSARLSESDVMMSTHNVMLIDEEGSNLNQQYKMPAEFVAKNVSLFCFNLGLTLVFRHEMLKHTSDWPLLIDEHDGWQRMAHDQWFCFLASALGTITYETESLAHYRQHGRNTFGAAKAAGKQVPMTLSLADRVAFYRRRMTAASGRANQLALIRRACDQSIAKQVEETRRLYFQCSADFERRINLLQRSLLLTRMIFLAKSSFLETIFVIVRTDLTYAVLCVIFNLLFVELLCCWRNLGAFVE